MERFRIKRKTAFIWGGVGLTLGVWAIGLYPLFNKGENKTNTILTPSTDVANALPEAHGIGTKTENVATETAQNSTSTGAATVEYRDWYGSTYVVTSDGLRECTEIQSFSQTGNTVYGAAQILNGFVVTVTGLDGKEIDVFHKTSGPNEASSSVDIGTDVCVTIGK